MTTLRNLAKNINISLSIRQNEPMSAHTTFKVGGNADLFISPATAEELAQTVAALKAEKVPFFVLGGGSNIVVSDNGISGAVLYTGNMRTIKVVGSELQCDCGVLMDEVAAFCAEHGLSGLESFSGLPGTVGGALYMNARCYEKSVSDVLESAVYYDCDAEKVCTYTMNDEEWAYKKSPFQREKAKSEESILKNADSVHGADGECAQSADAQNQGAPRADEMNNKNVSNTADVAANTAPVYAGAPRKIVLQAFFAVQPNSDPAHVAQQNAFYRADREQKRHFDFPSAGSVFKNNRAFGSPCGKIIDEAGLRGISVGGAQVAPWHGNFIINKGGATCADIKELVEKIKAEVYAKRGFLLESEIIFVGK